MRRRCLPPNGLASEVEPSRNQSADAGGEANEPKTANPATTAQPAIDPIDEACLPIARTCNLTNRETDVVRLLARGLTSSFIQEELVLSHNTVKTHVRHIHTKLDVYSRQEGKEAKDRPRIAVRKEGVPKPHSRKLILSSMLDNMTVLSTILDK